MDIFQALLKRTPFSWVETPEGLRLHISEDLYVFHQVLSEYRFSDLGEDDRVIDIGANIGVFSLLAAKRGASVLAVEPMTGNELIRNIRLNQARNIKVLECALGDGEEVEITWDGLTRRIPSLSLSQIIDEVGGCTFLKVDCEGGEWYIDPEELQGIRRIEMELHRKGNHERYFAFMEEIRKYFRIDYDPSPYETIFGIIHGYARDKTGASLP
jgi:FkbM family methyltransferase